MAEQGRVERVELHHVSAAVSYDYTGQRVHIREFIDETTPFPGPPGPPERDIRREELYLFREVKINCIVNLFYDIYVNHTISILAILLKIVSAGRSPYLKLQHLSDLDHLKMPNTVAKHTLVGLLH